MHFFPQNEIRAQCPDFNKMAMQAILSYRPAIVILAGRWDAFAAGELLIAKPQAARPTLAESIDNFVASLRSTVRALADAGHHVIVVGQVPLPKGNSVDCFERILMTRRDPSECAAASASRAGMELRVGELLRSAVAGKTGVRMVYPFDRLCGDRVCPILTGQSEFAYMDDSHLSASGAKLLSAGIGAAIVSLSRQSEAAAR
ncbi:MAG: hypothetical protein J2P49_09970 [Methylocapsa sp.]|nr:hypothetical protein [Methylocapsa sp.]